jgi:hypothetical protein
LDLSDRSGFCKYAGFASSIRLTSGRSFSRMARRKRRGMSTLGDGSVDSTGSIYIQRTIHGHCYLQEASYCNFWCAEAGSGGNQSSAQPRLTFRRAPSPDLLNVILSRHTLSFRLSYWAEDVDGLTIFAGLHQAFYEGVLLLELCLQAFSIYPPNVTRARSSRWRQHT